MKSNQKRLAVALLAASFAASGGVAMAKEKPREICNNKLLTYRQRYLCQQSLENIQTKADEKAVVRKYSDLVRAAEKAQEESK
jgi:hypothetical protein